MNLKDELTPTEHLKKRNVKQLVSQNSSMT